LKKFLILGLIPLLLMVPITSVHATGNMVLDSYCENAILHIVIQDQEGNPIKNANVYTMKDRDDLGKKFVSDENGIAKIPNEENLGMIKVLKSKFYDQTYPTSVCETILPEIPSWVKNNAKWWAEGQIDDSSFVTGIQFLVENNILVIPPTQIEQTTEVSTEMNLPSWVKNNAKWWSDGMVSESEFISSMQYLVKNQIIQIPERKAILDIQQPSSSSKISVSGGSLSYSKEALEILLFYTTHNPSCSPSEIKMMEKYKIMTEELLKDQNVGRKIIVNTACLQMDTIDASMYPLLLAQFNIMRPDLMIFFGDLTSNLELYYQEDAYGVWGCMAITSGLDCTTSVIIICECAPMYDEIGTNGGAWILSHELAHFLFNYKNYGPNVYGDAVHVVEHYYRECLENGFADDCSKYYVTKNIDGHDYKLMNLQLIGSNYKTLLAEIPTIEKELQLLNLKTLEIEINGTNELKPQDKQSIELSLSDNQEAVFDAEVSGNLIDFDGNVVKNFSALEQNDGKYLFSWNLGSDTKKGEYMMVIEIHHEDYFSNTKLFSFNVN